MEGFTPCNSKLLFCQFPAKKENIKIKTYGTKSTLLYIVSNLFSRR